MMATAPDGPAYVYRATLARVIDADTYDLAIDLGFRVSARLPVRLRGVNAAERSTVDGAAAIVAVSAFLAHPRALLIQSVKDRRSFERWVADIWADDAGEWVSLGGWLVQHGWAVRVP